MTTARSNPKLGRPIRRSEIIDRAESWLRPSVAYSQTRFHHTEHGVYRTDCSGYVSMAWGLPGIPPDRHGGLDTVGLLQVSAVIDRTDLLAGDILLNAGGAKATRHATIFHEWADTARTAYWGFEQAIGTGTIHRLISYPHESSVEHYLPYRNKHILT